MITASISTLLITWAYFRIPETNGKTYEEFDLLFEARVPAREFDNYDTSELKMRAIEKMKKQFYLVVKAYGPRRSPLKGIS